jgi:hypothetical protein
VPERPAPVLEVRIHGVSSPGLAVRLPRSHRRIGQAGLTVTVATVGGAFHVYDDERLLVEAPRTTAKPVARFKARKPELPRRTMEPQRCV